jgi:hypothetical protein
MSFVWLELRKSEARLANRAQHAIKSSLGSQAPRTVVVHVRPRVFVFLFHSFLPIFRAAAFPDRARRTPHPLYISGGWVRLDDCI